MSINGSVTHQQLKDKSPEDQLAYLDFEIKKCECKIQSLSEYRRELVNRSDLNKVAANG